MVLETKEKVDKAIAAIKALKDAVAKKNNFEQTVQRYAADLKNVTGATGDVQKILDESVAMVGAAHINGFTDE